GPGMPEMVMLTIQLQGRGLGEDVALITDGRFSGVSHGILIGHISPEAARGGPIAAVRDGDIIVIDPGRRTLDLELPQEEIARRMAQGRPPERADPIRPGSVHDKYVRLVSSAHYGCVLWTAVATLPRGALLRRTAPRQAPAGAGGSGAPP